MQQSEIRRWWRVTVCVLLAVLSLVAWPYGDHNAVAQRGGVLRIGMTAADIPYTAGQPDQGGEGYRFIGYQMYDALINWDLSQGDRLPDLVRSGRVVEVSKEDNTKWIFHLRRGVKLTTAASSTLTRSSGIWSACATKTRRSLIPNRPPSSIFAFPC